MVAEIIPIQVDGINRVLINYNEKYFFTVIELSLDMFCVFLCEGSVTP